ncbi:MAG: DUF4954 family protein [Phycisphaerae bacterium]|nr:DUF4954 family protein [Phycisphaerae bacterium]
MSEMNVVPMGFLGRDFVPAELLPPGEDEYARRNEQCGRALDAWRNLRADEIEVLVRNGNTCAKWDDILVAEQFNPAHVKNCQFFGLVRIGRVADVSLEYHDLRVPAGITNSRVVSCDIGDDTAIHNVRHLAHYIVGNNVMLLNIDEMHTSNHAKFGNGFIKDGEEEDVRVWLDLGNEAGGRRVMPFHGMTAGDAYLWSRYREDKALMTKLGEITQRQFDSRRGYYGQVGDGAVVKSCRVIKDVRFGPAAYVKGANKLKNLTIDSTPDEPTQIGEGVELVNGIVSTGCHIFYGCKAVRFFMAPCSNLKYGARLIHSYLGDNATVSCCEILSNLIFPAHEQHHNNSFLIAATVLGQSNIAAGATIGSNHNSRANDGEIFAGRGFWPGLCTSLKHSCRFASFTLLAKGDYPAELDVPLPFSLLSNDVAHDRLLVMPAYWWRYNMYALMRNSWKFLARDKRKHPVQHIEFDFLAPDSVEEILAALRLLAIWTAKARARRDGASVEGVADDELEATGRALLAGPAEQTDGLTVLGEAMENSRRDVVISRPRQAWEAYHQMLYYYAVKNLLDGWAAARKPSLDALVKLLGGSPRQTQWVNLGGQLMPKDDLDALREDIKAGRLADWSAIHRACDTLWEKYPLQKQQHAFATLLELLGETALSPQAWSAVLDKAADVQDYIAEQTYRSRAKDFENPFRSIACRSDAEREAVFGSPDDNTFVKQVRRDAEMFRKRTEAAKK